MGKYEDEVNSSENGYVHSDVLKRPVVEAFEGVVLEATTNCGIWWPEHIYRELKKTDIAPDKVL